MEFPTLGQHCSLRLCSKLDFLPIVCDACKAVFCDEHFSYQAHACPLAYTKNVTVPVCPLCDQPIPVKKGEDPNITVNEHISRDCEIPKKKKMYDKRCSFAGCKKKELVAMTCDRCHRNYCIQHRLEMDHSCKGPRPKYNSVFGNTQNSDVAPPAKKSVSKGTSSHGGGRQPQSSYLAQRGAELDKLRQARLSAMQAGHPVQQARSPPQPQGSSFQQAGPTLSEDEALAMAIAQSMQDQHPSSAIRGQGRSSGDLAAKGGGGGYDEDAALAQAIAQSLQEQEKKPTASRNPQQRNRTVSTTQNASVCTIS